MQCEKQLHKRSLVKLFTWTHLSHSVSPYDGFLKLVEVEALPQIHPCFFSHSIKQRVLLLSAVTVSLHHQPKTSEVSSHMRKNALITQVDKKITFSKGTECEIDFRVY